MKKHRERWTIVFQAADDHQPPVVHRIRRLLKAALRCYGLRCVSVIADHAKPLPPPPEALDPVRSEPPF